jgi:hypothetical protein
MESEAIESPFIAGFSGTGYACVGCGKEMMRSYGIECTKMPFCSNADCSKHMLLQAALTKVSDAPKTPKNDPRRPFGHLPD